MAHLSPVVGLIALFEAVHQCRTCPRPTSNVEAPCGATGKGAMGGGGGGKPLDALAINADFEIGYADFSGRIM